MSCIKPHRRTIATTEPSAERRRFATDESERVPAVRTGQRHDARPDRSQRSTETTGTVAASEYAVAGIRPPSRLPARSGTSKAEAVCPGSLGSYFVLVVCVSTCGTIRYANAAYQTGDLPSGVPSTLTLYPVSPRWGPASALRQKCERLAETVHLAAGLIAPGSMRGCPGKAVRNHSAPRRPRRRFRANSSCCRRNTCS